MILNFSENSMEAEDNSDEQEPRPPPSLCGAYWQTQTLIFLPFERSRSQNQNLPPILPLRNLMLKKIFLNRSLMSHKTKEERRKSHWLLDVTYSKEGKYRRTEILHSLVTDVRKRGCICLLLLVLKMKKQYFVIRAPGMKDHKCRASSHQVDIRAAKSQMYEMVAKEPTRSLLEIYEVVRQKYTAQMDPDSKLLFLQEFPSFLDLKTALLAQRRKFIPPDPKNMIKINIDLPVFLTKAGENVVKGDQLLEDGQLTIMLKDTTTDLDREKLLANIQTSISLWQPSNRSSEFLMTLPRQQIESQ